MKLHELWTVTAEWEDESKALWVEGRKADGEPIERYRLISIPEKNKGQWELVKATAAHEDLSTN